MTTIHLDPEVKDRLDQLQGDLHAATGKPVSKSQTLEFVFEDDKRTPIEKTIAKLASIMEIMCNPIFNERVSVILRDKIEAYANKLADRLEYEPTALSLEVERIEDSEMTPNDTLATVVRIENKMEADAK